MFYSVLCFLKTKIMTTKTRNIIGWILTALLAFVFIGSASMKLMASEQVIKSATSWGLSITTFKTLAFVEVISFLLFAIPRTGLLGTLLLTAYLGGAMATHLEHNIPIIPPMIVEALVWITATIRFPELSRRLMGKNLVV